MARIGSEVTPPRESNNKEENKFNIKDTEEYPNASDEPETIREDTTPEEKERHLDLIMKYNDGIMRTYYHTTLEGKDLWLDLITAFILATIKL